MVRERAARHGITVNQSVAPSVDQIESDELRIRQVLVNLLSNAVKFTPDGGRVDVMAEPVGDELVITVRDTGAGIAQRTGSGSSSRSNKGGVARRRRRGPDWA